MYGVDRVSEFDLCEEILRLSEQDTKRRYNCKYCIKTFTRIGHLRSHVKSSCYWNPLSACHQSSINRPNYCSECGSSYTKHSHLIYHIRHECGRTQKCFRCEKTFLHGSSLRRHQARCKINADPNVPKCWRSHDEKFSKTSLFNV